MPITSISGQVVPDGTQPYSNQSSLGQVIGECNLFNPSCSPTVITNFVNNTLRDYADRRMWYGLLRKGEFNAPGYYPTGTVNLTQGSATVQGVGTGWTSTLNGVPITQLQFRAGFTSPVYNITALDVGLQQLTLELPWGNTSISGSGYFITQYYYSVPNIKYLYSVKNLQLMYRMWTNLSQQALETYDPARLQFMYPRVMASMPPDKSGNAQFEMWPCPNVAQSFPYLAYCYWDQMTVDGDNFPPFTRIDVIKKKVYADVLRYRPRENKSYSEQAAIQIASQFIAEYEAGILNASVADEALWRQDATLKIEQFPLANMDANTGAYLGGGAYLAAMTPVAADDWC